MIIVYDFNENNKWTTNYNSAVNKRILQNILTRIGNQIFRLLPVREEDGDWKKPLETLVVEIAGISSLFPDNSDLFVLLSKLEGMQNKSSDMDFLLFRRTIFELCSLTNKIKDNI